MDAPHECPYQIPRYSSSFSYSWPLKRYVNETLVFSNLDGDKIIGFNASVVHISNEARVEASTVNADAHGVGASEESRKLEAEVKDLENVLGDVDTMSQCDERLPNGNFTGC